MKKRFGNFGTQALAGIALGSMAAVTFGYMFLVHAVTPGTVQNPTFGPQNDDVKLQLECVTASWKKNGSILSIETSSSGVVYPASTVASGINDPVSNAGQITCQPGWFMTGCSSFCGSNPDPDEAMKNQNTCQGTPNGSCTPDLTYIRCCKNL